MTRRRVANTPIGRVARAKEKRSLMPIGWTIRVAIWQRLHPMPPDVVDRLSLSAIGGLLNNHMVEADEQEVEAATRIMAERMTAVERFQHARQARKAKSKKKRP